RDAVRLLPSSVRSAELAAEHLPHRSADIQSALLGLVEKHASQPSVRERLERARASVAPSLAARVATLLSLDAMAARTSQVRAEERAAPPPQRESSTSVPGPIDGIADLVELLAALLEEIQDPHDIERALDGVSRLCGRTPDVARRREPIVKRAGKLLGDRAPARFDGHSPRSDIAGLIIAWATGTPPAAAETPHPLPRWLTGRSARPDPHQKSVLAFLSGRVREVAARAARGEAAPLLSLPTGRGGAPEVDEFEARQRRPADPPGLPKRFAGSVQCGRRIVSPTTQKGPSSSGGTSTGGQLAGSCAAFSSRCSSPTNHSVRWPRCCYRLDSAPRSPESEDWRRTSRSPRWRKEDSTSKRPAKPSAACTTASCSKGLDSPPHSVMPAAYPRPMPNRYRT